MRLGELCIEKIIETGKQRQKIEAGVIDLRGAVFCKIVGCEEAALPENNEKHL